MTKLVNKTLLGRYFVIEYIDRGSMAEVYKVWDTELAAHLAMKVLHQDLSGDKIFLRRFRREAETLAKLQHPSIVRFFSFKQEGRLAIILLDFIQGDTLKMKIFDRDNPFSKEEILSILNPVIRALHFAHNRGMVHCDIKPANIMIEDSGKTLLSDFGIARMTDAATATMVGAGTPAYMAPEQVRGEDPLPQTDIYALGIVLFEMLTGGERPFIGEKATITGSTGEKVRWEQLHLDPPSPTKWNPDISPELEAVVMKCLEKDPRKRYKSALDLLNAIELVLGERVTPAPEVVEPVQKPAPEPDLELMKPKPVKEKKPKPVEEKKPRPKKPENRYRRMADFRKQLEELLEGKKISWWRVLWLIVISIAVIALAVGSYYLFSSTQGSGDEIGEVIEDLTLTDEVDSIYNIPESTQDSELTMGIGGGTGHIVFQNKSYDGFFDISLLNVSTGEVKRVTNNSNGYGVESPRWSPEGDQIVFASDADGDFDIYVMDVGNGDFTDLTNNSWDDYCPAYSPDGRKIAFTSAKDENIDIYVMDLSDLIPIRLTDDSGTDEYPTWSPNGEMIAFHSNRDGDFDLYIINIDGTGLRNITSSDANDRFPDWSRDGKMIAFHSHVSVSGDDAEIYTIHIDGTQRTQLTNNSDSDAAARWSMDDSKILFHSNRNGEYQLFMMISDGTDQELIIDLPDIVLFGDWQPFSHIAVNPFAQNYPLPTPLPRWTVSPMMVDSPDPIPIEDLSGLPSHQVTYFDSLDTLSSGIWDQPAPENYYLISNGIIRITGRSYWNINLNRERGFNEGEAVLFQISFDQRTQFNASFASQTWNTDNYRRWGIYIFGDYAFTTSIFEGKASISDREIGTNLMFAPGRWYTVYMGIGDIGEFTTIIWDSENPTIQAEFSQAYGSGWDNLYWKFSFQGNSGNLYLSDYYELTIGD